MGKINTRDAYEIDPDCPVCQGKGVEHTPEKWDNEKCEFIKTGETEYLQCRLCWASFNDRYAQAKNLLERYSGRNSYTQAYVGYEYPHHKTRPLTDAELDTIWLGDDGCECRRLLKWLWEYKSKWIDSGGRQPVYGKNGKVLRYKTMPFKKMFAFEKQCKCIQDTKAKSITMEIAPEQYDCAVNPSELHEIIKRAKKFIDSASCLPILSYIKIEIYLDKIFVTATDLEHWYHAECKAEVQANECYILNYRVLSDILRLAKKYDRLTIRSMLEPSSGSKYIVKLCFGGAEYTLHGLSSDDYPIAPEDRDKTIGEWDCVFDNG